MYAKSKNGKKVMYGWGGVDPPLSSNVWPPVLSEVIDLLKTNRIMPLTHHIDHGLLFCFENGSITTGGHSDFTLSTRKHLKRLIFY